MCSSGRCCRGCWGLARNARNVVHHIPNHLLFCSTPPCDILRILCLVVAAGRHRLRHARKGGQRVAGVDCVLHGAAAQRGEERDGASQAHGLRRVRYAAGLGEGQRMPLDRGHVRVSCCQGFRVMV
jgi:hypothetical protein